MKNYRKAQITIKFDDEDELIFQAKDIHIVPPTHEVGFSASCDLHDIIRYFPTGEMKSTNGKIEATIISNSDEKKDSATEKNCTCLACQKLRKEKEDMHQRNIAEEKKIMEAQYGILIPGMTMKQLPEDYKLPAFERGAKWLIEKIVDFFLRVW